MFNEFELEVFFIKVKVKACLKNITEKTEEIVEGYGVRNKNKLTYHHNDMIIRLEIQKNSLKLIREDNNFIHTFNFKLDKETNSEYYIKEYHTNLIVKVVTTKLSIDDNNITINYIIKDSNDEYNYILDME